MTTTDRTNEERTTIINALNVGLEAILNRDVTTSGAFTTSVGVRPNGHPRIVVGHLLDDGNVNTFFVGHAWANDGNRVTIEPDVHHDTLRYNESKPTATVRDDRGPKAVAAALLRKVLPASEPLFKRERSIKAADEAHATATARNAQTLGNAAGFEFSVDNDGDARRLRISRITSGSSMYGEAEISGDNVGIKLHSVPVDLAADILRLIATHDKSQRTDNDG